MDANFTSVLDQQGISDSDLKFRDELIAAFQEEALDLGIFAFGAATGTVGALGMLSVAILKLRCLLVKQLGIIIADRRGGRRPVRLAGLFII